MHGFEDGGGGNPELQSILKNDVALHTSHNVRNGAARHDLPVTTTGEGSSDPHYTWGALMALIAIEEFVDINPWHGLRFGNLRPVEAGAIERYPIAGALYDVEMSNDSLRVRRNGQQIFAASAAVA